MNDKEKRDALINRIQFGGDEVVKAKGALPAEVMVVADKLSQTEVVRPPFRWLKACRLSNEDPLTNYTLAGAEFAEYVIQAAAGKTGKVVQAYVNLAADAGGQAIQKEIGADLEYFSVNIKLGVGDTCKTVGLY